MEHSKYNLIEPLLGLLRDHNRNVRAEAASAAGNLGAVATPELIATLTSLLRDQTWRLDGASISGGQDERLLMSVVDALGRLGWPIAGAAVCEALTSLSPEEVSVAIFTILPQWPEVRIFRHGSNYELRLVSDLIRCPT